MGSKIDVERRLDGQPVDGAAVSVVVPHYGDPEPTLALIAELKRQTPPPGQIIVADDHSPRPFPQLSDVLVIRRDANGGFGAAVNSGVRAADRELLLILNSDLSVGPTFLIEFLAAARPWLPAVLAPAIVDPDGHRVWSARRFPTPGHQIAEWLTPLAAHRHRPSWHRAVGHDAPPGSGSGEATDWVIGAALLLPRADFEAAGGFDERYYMNCEEIDLQRRLRDRGLPSIALPAPTVVHVGGGSSDPARRRAWLVAARTRYARKWGGLATLRVGLTAATAANLGWNAGRRLLGRDVRPLAVARDEWDLIWRKA